MKRNVLNVEEIKIVLSSELLDYSQLYTYMFIDNPNYKHYNIILEGVFIVNYSVSLVLIVFLVSCRNYRQRQFEESEVHRRFCRFVELFFIYIYILEKSY